MLNINIIDDTFLIKSINKDSIKDIYSIYKNTGDFKYATGIFYTIEYDQFLHQISQFILRQNVFFLNIYLVSTGELIGLAKGSVIDKDKIVWINSFVINIPYQSIGYGNRVIHLLEDYFKYSYEIEKIYLSVYKSNYSGINFWNKCGFNECDYLSKTGSKQFSEFVQFMFKKL